MVITGVARRSVEWNVNANSTKAGEGFHTYIRKYITVSDKALMDDEHDNMFQTCISVREGVAEFEWTLTGDTLGKTATIRYNRARGMVDTTIDSILKQEFDTYFVYAIDGLNPPRRIYFEATQYSDFSKESPLLEPDVINNIGIESPYSTNEHNKRHIGKMEQQTTLLVKSTRKKFIIVMFLTRVRRNKILLAFWIHQKMAHKSRFVSIILRLISVYVTRPLWIYHGWMMSVLCQLSDMLEKSWSHANPSRAIGRTLKMKEGCILLAPTQPIVPLGSIIFQKTLIPAF